jgi:hypothetical protein
MPQIELPVARRGLRRAIATLSVLAAATAMKPAAAQQSPLPEPQLVLGGEMLLIGYEADPVALRELLPAGLEPHPANMVILNMYKVPDASATSGLGAYTLTYLAVAVNGYDGYVVGSNDRPPGRYVAYYWNSSDAMRAYTRDSGFPDNGTGMTTMTQQVGKVVTTLTVDGKPFIEASAKVSGDWSPRFGGQNNYFGAKGEGSARHAVRFPLPYVCQALKTENTTVSFEMPASPPASKLKPKKVLWAARANCDIVYPQSVALRP